MCVAALAKLHVSETVCLTETVHIIVIIRTNTSKLTNMLCLANVKLVCIIRQGNSQFL